LPSFCPTDARRNTSVWLPWLPYRRARTLLPEFLPGRHSCRRDNASPQLPPQNDVLSRGAAKSRNARSFSGSNDWLP
jgi:hypothetical protein